MAKAAVAERVLSVWVPKKTLAEMTAHVAKYAANIPLVLTQALIESRDGGLSITCCDGETWVRRDCPAMGEDFTVCVNALEFAKKVAALPEGDVSITLGSAIEIASGRAKYTLPITDPVDFPMIPDAPDEFIEIDPKWAKAVASIVNPCFTEETKARPVLMGVNVRDRVASTNTHVAHRINGFPELPFGEKTIYARHAVMLPLCESICFSDNRIFLKASGLYIVGATINLQYPNVDKVFPDSATRFATFESDALESALKRAAPVADLRARWVRFTFGPDCADIESYTHDLTQSFNETLPCVGINLEGFQVAVNYKYLLDCISIAGEDAIKMDFSEASRNFTIHGEGDYIGCICPMAL